MSALDIDAGRKWGPDIERQLEASKIGVLCVTSENLTQPWLMFEAGAISKQVTQARVIPYLFGVTNADLQGPLSQFQAVSADEEGTFNLMKSINRALTTPIKDPQLEKAFSAFWPDLEKTLAMIREEAAKESHSKAPPQRSDRELLEEMLTLVRRLDQAEPLSPAEPLFAGSWHGREVKRIVRDVRRLTAELDLNDEDRAKAVRRLADEAGVAPEAVFDALFAPEYVSHRTLFDDNWKPTPKKS